MNKLVLKIENKSKGIVRKIAYDTGDMEFAISHNRAKIEGNSITAEVFVDSTKLYSKRKWKKGSSRKSPINVNNGTKYMKARPFFTSVLKNIQQEVGGMSNILKVDK